MIFEKNVSCPGKAFMHTKCIQTRFILKIKYSEEKSSPPIGIQDYVLQTQIGTETKSRATSCRIKLIISL